MRRRDSGFRRAVAASIGVHVVLAAALIVAGRWVADRAAPPGIDTRVPDQPRISFLIPDMTVMAAPDSRPKVTASPSPVVEVPVTPGTLHPRPATPPSPGTAVREPSEAAAPALPQPVHGAMSPGQSIVYVLDASGSMGEWGKFDAARRALLATLRGQPETVRFQVIIYNGTARVMVTAGGCVPATPENVRQAEARLLAAAPAGRSDHAAGLRAAIALHPDFVLFMTDADDLPAAKLRGLLAAADRRPVVCVARAGAAGVGAPAEWR